MIFIGRSTNEGYRFWVIVIVIGQYAWGQRASPHTYRGIVSNVCETFFTLQVIVIPKL